MNRLGDLDFYLCHLSFSGALLIPFDFPASPYVTAICERGEITAVKVRAGEGSSTKALGIEKEELFKGTFSHHLFCW